MPPVGARSYVGGFVGALLLTAAAFALVGSHRLTFHATVLLLGVLGLLQVVVHLRYFLQLRWSNSPREEWAALAFTAVLLVVMIGGSLWIMFDLHYRMMPVHRML